MYTQGHIHARLFLLRQAKLGQSRLGAKAKMLTLRRGYTDFPETSCALTKADALALTWQESL
jgi:hypothetical protein